MLPLLTNVSAPEFGRLAPLKFRPPRLGPSMAFSALVHLVVVAGAVMWARRPEPARPPVYRVQLLGAPPGPRQAGVVDAAAKPTNNKPIASGAERPAPTQKALPTKKVAPVVAPKATPNPTQTRDAGSKTPPVTNTRATAAPKAGAGAQGGKGADVANVDTHGIEFPYPGYLSNIQRQVLLNWSPRRTSAALLTEVKFMIRRDGSVVGIELVKPSGDPLYNADAMGAIEAVGTNRGFGPLPAGFSDDVLIVYFTFDYALRR